MGLTEASNQILAGTLFDNYDIEAFPELTEFVRQLAMPNELKREAAIDVTITEEEYRRRIFQWREATTTSPSGRHLGIIRQASRNISSAALY